ncbi:MAG: NAD(P)H-quinone oxidoreductase [Rhodobacteraceae bacterium]|nr:NAD(P)H-quinone oxidoreductase [Paracoccaceae bacterium]
MRVIKISQPGGPEVLTLASRPIPKPTGNHILIKNKASGVNRPDVLQRMGTYNPPEGASDLPGLECSGEVVAIGERVRRWNVGDNVCALLPGGGYAEYSLTHEDHALPIPQGMNFIEASAICETHFTVWSNVFVRGKLKAGDTFLVHGGSSGIGTTAIQLANAFGARVFTTAGSEKKCNLCRQLGAELAINYQSENFGEIIRSHTEGQGVNVILDMVGGDYMPKNLRILATDGILVQIAFLKNPKIELNFASLMVRRQTITGSTLRPQSDLAKSKIADDLRQHVLPYLNSGRIKPIIDSVYKLEDVAEAHSRMESSTHMGKIVLTMDE